MESAVNRLRVLLVYDQSPHNATLSYQNGWPRHFVAHPRFSCTPINLGNRTWAASLRARRAVRDWTGDAVVMLHSVFSNSCPLNGHLFDAIRHLSQPKAFFIGNEFKFMPEKMRFCEEIGVSLLITMSSAPAVGALYYQRLGCAVIHIPSAALDPILLRPITRSDDRPIDLGYRAYDSPWYLGHQERGDIAGYFASNAARLGVSVDISLEPSHRFTEPAWAAFLNRCKGQLGTEAGGDYFELTDETRNTVNAYLADHPDATFADIRARFFEGRPAGVPIRTLSGRNIEAAGTRTVQLLFEGTYDGYFQPDVHYISLRKDFSNVDDAIRKFRDRAFAARIADDAYRLATEEFAYERLIGRFAEALAPLV